MADRGLLSVVLTRRGSRQPRIRRGTLAALLGFVIVIGPWPADNSPFVASSYQRKSLDCLQTASVARACGAPLYVGVATKDISPPEGHPLAGFLRPQGKGYHGIHSRCYVRALTIRLHDVTATILTADLLLINAKLARAVLQRTGLSPEQVYFTASHTHSGPGGWGDHLLEKLIAGAYDPAYFDFLAAAMAEVVVRSRQELKEAELAFVSVQTAGRQQNRVEPAPLDDRVMALVFRAPQPSSSEQPLLAMLVIFSAHAVVFDSDHNQLSADYPGEVMAHLRDRTGCPAVLFASGAVGEATVIRPRVPTAPEQARILGQLLANDVWSGMERAQFQRQAIVANLRLPVQLPGFRVSLTAAWRLSPFCTRWISDGVTHLHLLRVGPALLAGFPGDYSWRLADRLEHWCREHDLALIPTSFNGDYKGYFVTRATFEKVRHYETRTMNFFGPWGGEYLSDLALRMAEHMEESP